MYTIRNGRDFDRAVFGERSAFSEDRVLEGARNFSDEMNILIAKTKQPYPDTLIGRSLYFHLWQNLARAGVDPSGLIFGSAINSNLDVHHFTDGSFVLPQIRRIPITIDAFFLEKDLLKSLTDYWVFTFEGDTYNPLDFQADLYQYKSGFAEFRRRLEKRKRENGRQLGEDILQFSKTHDFRIPCCRPENHFILTPYHVQDYRRQKEFAKMVATYLASKVGGQKTALLGP